MICCSSSCSLSITGVPDPPAASAVVVVDEGDGAAEGIICPEAGAVGDVGAGGDVELTGGFPVEDEEAVKDWGYRASRRFRIALWKDTSGRRISLGHLLRMRA